MRRLGEILAGDQTLGSNTSADADPGQSIEVEPPDCALCNDAGFVRLERAVGHPEFGQVVPCECAREAKEASQQERLERYSNLGGLREINFERLIGDGSGGLKETYATARAFARREDPPSGEALPAWLIVWSSDTAAKTHVGAAMANDRIELGLSALYFVVPDLLDHLRAAYSKDAGMPFPQLFEKVRSAPFLILDDLDAANPTAWAQEKLFQLLNHRQAVGLPTVVLAARDPESIPEPLGPLLRRFAGSHVVALEPVAPGGSGEGARYREIGGMREAQLREHSFAGFRVEGFGLSDEDADALADIRGSVQTWADEPTGWLLLEGPPGSGKSHLAAAVAARRLELGESVYFAVVPELLDYLRRAYGPVAGASYDEVLGQLQTTDLLVLDDLGAHSTSAWAEEKLYQLLSYRYLQKLPTVITTNQSGDLDERLVSRIGDHRITMSITLDVGDFRRGRQARPERPPPGRPGKWGTRRW